MNKLLRYILIVNIISLILIGLFAVGNVMYENYTENYYSQEQVDAAQQAGQLLAVPKGPLYSLGMMLSFLFMYILPVFVVFMSGIYQYKNPGIKNYAKSLLIPLSYAAVAFILTLFLGWLFGALSSEKGIALLFYWYSLLGTFCAVMIVNFIILLFKRT